MYADKMTKSMTNAIAENNRRRAMQKAYNTEHGITPVTVKREVVKSIANIQHAIAQASEQKRSKKKQALAQMTPEQVEQRMVQIEQEMQEAAERLDFEKAIALREEWFNLKKLNQ